MSASTLAEELRRIRGIKNISLREVEKATKISNAYLSQLESGNATNPSPHILYKLAQFYGVPYETLMKAAGYLKKDKEVKNNMSIPVSIQAALMTANLTDDESREVADFIKFVRSRQIKQDK